MLSAQAESGVRKPSTDRSAGCAAEQRRAWEVLRTYLPDGPITDSDDIKECGHDLGQELHTLESQGLEDEGDGLNHHGVVVRERLISEDPHQGHHGHSGVKLVQGQISHVDQHFTGAVVS